MIQNMEQLMQAIDGKPPVSLVVAAGNDEDVIKAVAEAVKRGWISGTLVGSVQDMEASMEGINVDASSLSLLEGGDSVQSVHRAMERIRDGQDQILMKGSLATADLLRGVLSKEYGQRGKGLLSHVALCQTGETDSFLFITDGAVNIAPDVQQKKSILENAVVLARMMGYERPNAAVICAVEKVNEKMQATLDAKILVDLAQRGDIQHCNVSGPFALDNALSRHSALVKGIKDPFAGESQILLMPNIEAGNILFKALVYLAKAKTAAVVLGAKIPVVLTSRSDDFEAKLYSIALAVFLAQQEGK